MVVVVQYPLKDQAVLDSIPPGDSASVYCICFRCAWLCYRFNCTIIGSGWNQIQKGDWLLNQVFTSLLNIIIILSLISNKSFFTITIRILRFKWADIIYDMSKARYL